MLSLRRQATAYPHTNGASALPLFLACLMLFSVFAASPRLFAKNSDGPWHIASGQYVFHELVENHRFPYEDPFSFTPHTETWVNPAWLYDVVMGVIAEYSTLGATIFCTALLAAALAYAMAKHLLQRGISPLVLTFAMVLQLSLLGTGIALRPQIMTLYGAATLYLLLHHSATHPKKLLWVPLIMMLWANLHGGIVIGLLIFGAFGLEALLQRRWRYALQLSFAGIAGIAASFVTPYGWELYDLIYRTMTGVMLPYIEEWGSPFKHQRWHMLVLYLLILLWALPCTLRPQSPLLFRDAVLLVITLLMAADSIRHLSLLGLLGAPAFCQLLHQKLQPLTLWNHYEKRWREWLTKPPATTAMRNLFATLSLIILAASLFWPKWEETLIPPEEYPVAEINYLRENCPRCRTYALYDYAGTLLYFSRGKVPVFYDSRAENVYSQQLLADGIHISTLQSGWQYLLDKYEVEALLMPLNHPVFSWLAKEKDWHFAYRGAHAEIWIRQTGQTEKQR